MPATVVVDPAGETIRVDDRVWPFVWDPSAAAITIELSGHSYTLTDVTWRQKRNLARARERAGLPLRSALVRACLRESRTMPTDPLEKEALVSLAEWLVATGQELPWQPAILARAMLEVCRAAALTPAEVDDLPASDVEELWLATRNEQPRAAAASAGREHERAALTPRGFKKILIVPDPGEDAPSKPNRSASAATNEAPAVAHMPEANADLAPGQSVETESESPAAASPVISRARTRPAVRAVPTVVRRTARSARAHAANGLRFRLARVNPDTVGRPLVPPRAPDVTAPSALLDPMSGALRERDVSRDVTPQPDHIAPDALDRAWPKVPTATSTRVRSVDRDLMMEFLADRAPAPEVAGDWRQQLEDELSRAAVEAGLDPEY